MDLIAELFAIGFEGALVAVAALLVATFALFLRMNPDVRRARIYIMANRVIRFLGAFTLGFVLIAVTFLFTILSIPPPPAVAAGAVVGFIGAVLFGSLELFLIVRPRRAARPRRTAAPEAETSLTGGHDAAR